MYLAVKSSVPTIRMMSMMVNYDKEGNDEDLEYDHYDDAVFGDDGNGCGDKEIS